MNCTVFYFEFLDEVAVLFLTVQFFVVGLRFLLQIKNGFFYVVTVKTFCRYVSGDAKRCVLLNLYFCCFLFDGLFKCVQNYTSSKCR